MGAERGDRARSTGHPAGTCAVDLPALAGNVRRLRREVGAWLAEVCGDQNAVEDLVLAVGEALANCVDHAFVGRPEPGTMRVFARLEGDQVVITVRDNGRWREPDREPGWRGRGIPLIAELTDDADIDPRPGGTVVVLRRAVTTTQRRTHVAGSASGDLARSADLRW